MKKRMNDQPVPFRLEEPEPDTGRDFLGQPVACPSLLIPTIELKKFGEHVLRKHGIILPTLEMCSLYSEYVKTVIKPKYERRTK